MQIILVFANASLGLRGTNLVSYSFSILHLKMCQRERIHTT